MLKYNGYEIVLQEIPDEITLAFNICNCPHHCEGCHSDYLWGDSPTILKDDVMDIIRNHLDEISCVCFMGGDQELKELIDISVDIKYQFLGLKVGIYSGADKLPPLAYQIFDYVKVGHYDQNLGGLISRTTNQRMYRNTIKTEDITWRFCPNANPNLECL